MAKYLGNLIEENSKSTTQIDGINLNNKQFLFAPLTRVAIAPTANNKVHRFYKKLYLTNLQSSYCFSVKSPCTSH